MSDTSVLERGGLTGLLDAPGRERDLLEGVAGRALEKAKAGGAGAAEVAVSSSLGRAVTVRLGAIETQEEARDRGITVTVYRGNRVGSASSGDLQPETVDEAVARALAIAEYTQPDPAAGLADKSLMATEFPDLDLWHPAGLEIGDLAARARIVEDAGRDLDARITNSEGAMVSEDAAVGVYANSHGFSGSRASTRYGQSCVLVAGAGGGMQRDWWWDRKRRFDILDAPEHTGRRAAERTLARLGARRVPTGRVPVLFTPEAAGSLLGHLVGAVSGGNLYRRTTFLLDALDTQLFPDWVHIAEHPREPGGARSAAFDQEGVATRESPLIESGRLARYVLDSYSGRRLKRETTANAGGVRNLRLEPGTKSQTELTRDMGRGLVVTEMMGQGVNLVTGDYSRGASGFWVENGDIAHPVEEITIAGHLGEMFAGLVAAGSDLEDRSNIQVPSLVVDSLMVGGE